MWKKFVKLILSNDDKTWCEIVTFTRNDKNS